jgi:hypothetical protein
MAVRPLKQVLVHALLRVVGAVLGVSAVLGVAAHVHHDPPGAAVAESHRVVDEGVGDLVRRDRCWSGDAPADMAGRVPGHALVRLPHDDAPRLVDSSVGFGIWLDGDPGHLYAFCR